ncbi:uncharacterized protein LOC101218084 [Cucumis sativus]|uniref:8-amino-7-oxononanoate synthase n=1 Tax=Cucumis sativus TaxID=3659 RepID=A0A0A0L2K0_CUCSA|nr:uncharacterized protein LOC101218084 [Cucumis sativus]KGN54356.1 hypothetical protein Csa_018126 [Cucumis sativus]
MIVFKPIQTSFTVYKNTFLYTPKLPISKNSFSCLCQSNTSDSAPSTPPPEGDPQKQEILARIAQLQTQKLRLTGFLDEKSADLTQFAEEADAEFEKIGEDALRGLDEASARIMGNIESQMQVFEESVELNRQEIEKNDDMLAKFEGQIEEERNEGLFFQNLRPRKPADKVKAKVEMEKINKLTKENAGSKTRRYIYLAFIGLLVVAIAESFLSSPDWRKVAVLGAMLIALISQFSYEQRMASEIEKTEIKEQSEEKD